MTGGEIPSSRSLRISEELGRYATEELSMNARMTDSSTPDLVSFTTSSNPEESRPTLWAFIPFAAFFAFGLVRTRADLGGLTGSMSAARTPRLLLQNITSIPHMGRSNRLLVFIV